MDHRLNLLKNPKIDMLRAFFMSFGMLNRAAVMVFSYPPLLTKMSSFQGG